ncbi:Anti-sigma-factor antagonist [Candidatus Magnetomorum sp. HK-1]|nr:Anti-sigma-factor antagonist [Candidatus Magnetomorum sp. HK-1]
MFNLNENDNLIKIQFSSDMVAIDRVVEESKIFFSHLKIPIFLEFKIVLRELLINAVEHGNKNDFNKNVTCSIEYLGDLRFKIIVEDEGQGFNYKSQDMKMPENPEQNRNRGFALINSSSEIIKFNEKGNQIIVYLGCSKRTSFESKNEGEWEIITASNDITAAVVDEFRIFLIGLLDKGIIKFRFDLKYVDDIDSRSLSIFIIFSKMLKKINQNGVLEIINANNDLNNLFKMTGLDGIYKIK